MKHSREIQIRFYKALLRIRRVEEILADEYRKGTMRTPTHFGIGQEAVAVGVCEALVRGDVVYSHHRCHTHYLARGGNLFGLVAELLGREAGCSRGRGGSVHLTDRSAGFLGSSPILGEGMALATGTALSYQMDGSQNVSVAFFGEGACEEGSAYECLNFASIRKLPVLYVCENNLYATESPLSVRQPAGTDLCERVRSFKIATHHTDGNDVFAVYEAARKALDHCHSGNGPFFLACDTYRWREHCGPLYDNDLGYRTEAEFLEWKAREPIGMLRQALLAEKAATASDFEQMQSDIDREVEAAFEFAERSPFPPAEEAFTHEYAKAAG